MKKNSNLKNYFSGIEITIWAVSAVLIVLSFIIFDRSNYLTIAASLIGATSIMLNAKGNPLGQLLMVLFSMIYGYISFSCAYYGEMITYLGMTMPMAIFALITWVIHPFKGIRSEVEVSRLDKKELVIMPALSLLVTVIFYFILKSLGTANIIPSTLSVTTSFLAVYLTFKRSPYFSLAYACNDIVLLVLWILASMESINYISVVVCFSVFLINDIYAFISWKKMEKRQQDTDQLLKEYA